MSKKKGIQKDVSLTQNEEIEASYEVVISDELRLNPLFYSGSLGTFGVGAALERQKLGRNGFPPGEKIIYPEATQEQYLHLAKTGDYERYGLYIAESKANSRRGDEG